MRVIETVLPGVFILEPQIIIDKRGWFMESWSVPRMRAAGLAYNFVQDNHSYSAYKGVLRGIHFQIDPAAQAKLVRCIRGCIQDVTIDLRKNSPTFKKWLSVELSADNKRQIIIPRGFGHGFLTLTDDAEIIYKTDSPYNAAADRSIRWDDPELSIQWDITHPILSDKDAAAPALKDSDCNFIWEGAI